MNTKTLQEIWIYPIKSLPGVSLQKSQVLPKGLQYDRRWMLVDENGNFLTQRTIPEMALFNVFLENQTLVISPKNSFEQNLIYLDLNQQKFGKAIQAKVWNDNVEVLEVNEKFSLWFSKQLNINCKLVYFPESNTRDIDHDYARNNEQVNLSDGYPILIIGQSSLDELNRKLEMPLSIHRFRPNFVFSKGKPHEEDNWKSFHIGNILFEGVKPCSRCVVTTINTDTGEKGHEPLKALANYRKLNGKIYFGENIIPRTSGDVQIGDIIEVESFKQ